MFRNGEKFNEKHKREDMFSTRSII